MYQDQPVYVHVEVVSLGHYVKVLFIYVNVLHVLVATILSSFHIIVNSMLQLLPHVDCGNSSAPMFKSNKMTTKVK